MIIIINYFLFHDLMFANLKNSDVHLFLFRFRKKSRFLIARR